MMRAKLKLGNRGREACIHSSFRLELQLGKIAPHRSKDTVAWRGSK